MGKLIATIAVLIFLQLSVFAHGDLHKQIDDLSAQIKTQPESAALYLRRGRLHLQHRDLGKAMEDARHALSKGAKVDGRLLEAEIHFAAKEWSKAETAASLVLAESAEEGRGLVVRARARKELKKFDLAAGDYKRALEKAPRSDPDVYLETAECLENSGEFDKGLGIIEDGLKTLGNLPAFQKRAVLLEAKAGKVEAALTRIARYRQAERRQHFWSELEGDVQMIAGRPDLARAAYQRALDGSRVKSPELAQKLSSSKTPPAK